MAKAGTIHLIHRSSSVDLFLGVKFSVKSKRFEVTLPDMAGQYALSRTGSSTIVAESFALLEGKAKAIFNEFCEQSLKEEKIIVYKVAFNLPGKTHSIHHAPNLAIGIDWKVLYKTTIGESEFLSEVPYEQCKQPEGGIRLGGYRLKSMKGIDNEWSNYQTAQYTDELEHFLKNVSDGMVNLIEKIEMFFGKEPEHLLNSISGNKKLFEGAKTNK